MALLGYHAMAGTRLANLEHTMTSAAWHSFRVNGEAWGEVAIDAKIASEAGVPVIMVSGDDRLCREADAFLPGVERACVKHGGGTPDGAVPVAREGQRARARDDEARGSAPETRAGFRAHARSRAVYRFHHL